MRGYGTGLSDLGDSLTWGEAKTLLEEASGDGSTALGAKLAGWGYRASMLELLTLAAQLGNKKAFEAVMPWNFKVAQSDGPAATPDEIAAAEAELEAGIVFT